MTGKIVKIAALVYLSIYMGATGLISSLEQKI